MNQSESSEPADIETSSNGYATRFSGPTGEWMLGVQEKIVLDMLSNHEGASILDVGGGHGQLAIPLCRENFHVIVLGSAESCRARIASLTDNDKCRFMVGNITDIPFDDKSFDIVLCFRLLTHTENWPRLIEELCRVARHSVIADYPTSRSLNIIAPALFKAKKKLEGNTRTWRLFTHKEVRNEFAKNGFVQDTRIGQFFLPMVLHRALKCRRLSAFLEYVCGALGLLSLLGSPVIVKMSRQPES